MLEIFCEVKYTVYEQFVIHAKVLIVNELLENNVSCFVLVSP